MTVSAYVILTYEEEMALSRILWKNKISLYIHMPANNSTIL